MHIPVLLSEVLEGLNISPSDIVLDGTLGGGGYASEILGILGAEGHLIGLDVDRDAIHRVAMRFKENSVSSRKYTLVQENFRNLDRVLDRLHITHLDKAVFDLGISSYQLEDAGRGLSFQKDEPLLMTLERDSPGLTAREIVNEWREENIADILFHYGEERYARRIARAIVAYRRGKRFERTPELVEVVTGVVPRRQGHHKIHPATKTFQALRIAVNDEIGALREGLTKAFERLAPRGSIAVISFHSLEDRIVKHFFKTLATEKLASIITKKPITPSLQEIAQNPRSRSAKLRIVTKL